MATDLRDVDEVLARLARGGFLLLSDVGQEASLSFEDGRMVQDVGSGVRFRFDWLPEVEVVEGGEFVERTLAFRVWKPGKKE